MIEPKKIDDGYASAEERFQAYFELFLLLKGRLFPVQYRDYIGINIPQLTHVVAMYLDDRERIKKENRIERLHRSKVAAYLVKWILHCKPIYTTFDRDTWGMMSEEQKIDALNINYYYAFLAIFHTLGEFQQEDFYPGGKFRRVRDDLFINMRMGKYNEQATAILFDAIAAHYAEQDNDPDQYTA